MRKSRIDNSTGKPARQSRIAQPIKRSTIGKKSSSDRRSISEDREYSVKKRSLAAPRMFYQRSSSATPMRTPIRTPLHLAHGTATKKTPLNDKKWFEDQLNRIFGYIGNIEGVDRNFVASRNIKLMSIKDFLKIVCHLAKFWLPAGVTFSNDYVDNIYEMLCKLGYPYRVNKSWLKTPNAPHALNDVVILISWLLDAVPQSQTSESFEENAEIEGFPTKAFAQYFQQSVRDAYQLWNNGQDQEATEMKVEVLNEFIKESGECSSEEELQKNISMLKDKCDELEVQVKEWESKQQMVNNLQKQVEERNKQLKSIHSETETKSSDIELNSLKIASMQQSMKELMARKEAVEKEWEEQRQENRVSQHEELKKRLNEDKIVLEATVELSEKVKAIGFEVQVEKSRLLKKVHDLTNETNLSVESVLKYRPSGMQIDDLTLEPNLVNSEKVAKIHETLGHIQQMVSAEIQKNNMQIISLNSEVEFGVSRDIDRCEKSLLKLTEQFSELESFKAKYTSTSEHKKATLDGQIGKAEKMKSDLDMSIEKIKEQIGQEKERQQKILEKFDKDTDEQLRQKRELVEKTKKDVASLHKKLKKLKKSNHPK